MPVPPQLVGTNSRRLIDLIRYFRRSLLDIKRLGPDAKSVASALTGRRKAPEASQAGDDASAIVIMSISEFTTGQVQASTYQAILAALRASHKKGDKAEVSAKTDRIRLAILPWIGTPENTYGSKRSGASSACLPICFQADMLSDGILVPIEERPWFAREWLEGTVGDELPFGDALQVDRFNESRSAESLTEWSEMIAAVDELCGFVANATLAGLHHPDFRRYEGVAVIVGDTAGGATFHILPVYDELLRSGAIPPLLVTLLREEPRPVEDIPGPRKISELDHGHVGQMRGDFGLAARQRVAIQCHLRAGLGEIVAINGPPGTGKTTFIQTVVATEFTRSACEGVDYPPVIVAASSNNRAVTNILDTFRHAAAATADGDPLASRWIPDVQSYGLYCPSSDKQREAKAQKHPFRKTGRGPVISSFTSGGEEITIEDDRAVTAATSAYLGRCSSYAKRSVSGLAEAVALLHGRVKERVDTTRSVLRHHADAHAALHATIPVYRTPAELDTAVSAAAQQLDGATREFHAHAETTDAWRRHVEARPWWVWLFVLLGFRREQVSRANQVFCDLHGLHMGVSTEDQEIDAYMERTRKDLYFRRATASGGYTAVDKRRAAFHGATHQLASALVAMGCDAGLASDADFTTPCVSPDIADALDRGPRYAAFLLAVHYWEGRWLQQVMHDVKHKNTPDLRRHSMLFPCSVCTFYMLPKEGFFPAGEGIDLLIVDEAGQAPPVIAAAAFARAKRALVVGDIDQIEPVWTLPRQVDEANLRDAKLLGAGRAYTWWWDNGRCAAHGNLMRLAQDACRYHPFAERNLSRGLYLTEHRRCREPIISFCNELVYGGVLESKRPADPNPIMPPMVLIDMPVGTSTKRGGSRCNETEALAIVDWISEWRRRILERFPVAAPGSRDPLASRLAVITPFKAQARLIEQYMRKRGLPSITVGTVHSLQGAECDVVIFSSVYGGNDQVGTLFYDRSPNLLNVAVSRAKENFVVFADLRIFGRNAAAPSGVLRRTMVVD